MLNQKIKSPLWVMTIVFTLGFLDGFLELGMTDGVYALLGFAMIASLVWMWVIVNKYE